jgi:hypothetical protein
MVGVLSRIPAMFKARLTATLNGAEYPKARAWLRPRVLAPPVGLRHTHDGSRPSRCQARPAATGTPVAGVMPVSLGWQHAG